MTLRVEVPRKLKPLLYPARYKGAYGGRGGAKSHFFGEQLILRCYTRHTDAVCIREVQQSIRDSVRKLLVEKIEKFELQDAFEILEHEIRCRHNGSLIIFRGMQSFNAGNIKSLEGFDIAWIEEAQTLSQHSLDLLRPTLRKEGSELWFSWNPRFKTDPVDQFFRKRCPDNAVSVQVNWSDNPWLPAVLRKEMADDYADDPDKADHVWGGAYGSGQGAILSRWVNQAMREGRVTDRVEYDPGGAPVEISGDLGFRDTASWWYWQRAIGGYRLLRYDGDNGLDADDWIARIQKTLKDDGLTLGKIWLPHDARAKTFQSKYTSVERFLSAFGNGKVDIVAQSKKADQISAARAVIPKCEFHVERCESGLDGLFAWEFEYSEENNVFSREPLHNWASHPADAFAYGCQIMQFAEPPKPTDIPTRGIFVGQTEVTMNELWQTAPQASKRI